MAGNHRIKNAPFKQPLPLSLSSDSNQANSTPGSGTTESTQQSRTDKTQQRDQSGGGDGSGTGPSQAGDSVIAALSEFRTDQKIALAGAVVAGFGSVLPWATVLGTNVSGLQGDGILTLILAGIAAVVTVMEPDAIGKWNNGLVGGCGVLVVMIGLLALNSAAAIGLYLTIIGGLVISFPQLTYMYRRYQSGAAEGV
ncbi:hypothetical protein [Halococcus agarilyticus]|uniref:hypothetical protein n=1 Tax=Halococcus agarilyticus TaxID=1232219 RepID=UPI0012AB7116|nr:hypothetical protein [Halococcus agarilyticus]